MSDWVQISEVPPPKALLIAYIGKPYRAYALCTAEELPEIIEEYKNASHWKLVTLAP